MHPFKRFGPAHGLESLVLPCGIQQSSTDFWEAVLICISSGLSFMIFAV